MNFFKPKQPILQKKKLSLSSEELTLMKCLQIKALEKLRLCGFYTCIDQAMLIWAVMSGIIFLSAQFLPISWSSQAIFWSVTTVLGVIAMCVLNHSWVNYQKISWVLYSWSFLMIVGVIITDMAIALGWSSILLNLCELWLGLSAIGYIATGWMLRSRAFFLSAFIHTATILVLPWCMGWQFAMTGLIMMSNLLIFSEGQWDMLLPKEILQYSMIRLEKNPSFSLPSFFLPISSILLLVIKKIAITFRTNWRSRLLIVLIFCQSF